MQSSSLEPPSWTTHQVLLSLALRSHPHLFYNNLILSLQKKKERKEQEAEAELEQKNQTTGRHQYKYELIFNNVQE